MSLCIRFDYAPVMRTIMPKGKVKREKCTRTEAIPPFTPSLYPSYS